jgi:hypothetical protein
VDFLGNNACVLVDAALVVQYAVFLILFRGFVILTQRINSLASIDRQNCPTIPSISHIDHLIDHKYDNGAGASSVYITDLLDLALCKFEEQFFCLSKALNNCFYRLIWEVLVLNDELV